MSNLFKHFEELIKSTRSQDDLLSGIDLSMLTPDEIDALNKINNDLYQDLPRGLRQAAGQPSTSNECTCDMRDLLTGGCRCGAFKREKAKERK